MARKYISAKNMDQEVIANSDPFILISDDSEDDDVVVLHDQEQDDVEQRLQAPAPDNNNKTEDTEIYLPSDVLKDLDEFTRQMETDLWKSRYEKLNKENQVDNFMGKN